LNFLFEKLSACYTSFSRRARKKVIENILHLGSLND